LTNLGDGIDEETKNSILRSKEKSEDVSDDEFVALGELDTNQDTKKLVEEHTETLQKDLSPKPLVVSQKVYKLLDKALQYEGVPVKDIKDMTSDQKLTKLSDLSGSSKEQVVQDLESIEEKDISSEKTVPSKSEQSGQPKFSARVDKLMTDQLSRHGINGKTMTSQEKFNALVDATKLFPGALRQKLDENAENIEKSLQEFSENELSHLDKPTQEVIKRTVNFKIDEKIKSGELKPEVKSLTNTEKMRLLNTNATDEVELIKKFEKEEKNLGKIIDEIIDVQEKFEAVVISHSKFLNYLKTGEGSDKKMMLETLPEKDRGTGTPRKEHEGILTKNEEKYKEFRKDENAMQFCELLKAQYRELISNTANMRSKMQSIKKKKTLNNHEKSVELAKLFQSDDYKKYSKSVTNVNILNAYIGIKNGEHNKDHPNEKSLISYVDVSGRLNTIQPVQKGARDKLLMDELQKNNSDSQDVKNGSKALKSNTDKSNKGIQNFQERYAGINSLRDYNLDDLEKSLK